MFDQWDIFNTIGDHSKWVSLGFVLPSVHKSGLTIAVFRVRNDQ